MGEIGKASKLTANATATIYITGLAYCWEIDEVWNVRFIHPSGTGHDLKVSIVKETGGGSMEIYEKTLQPTPSISIRGKNASAPQGDDLAGIINMDTLHRPRAVRLPAMSPDRIEVSHLTISNSNFYTAGATKYPYDIVPIKTGFPRGFIGNVIGADITCGEEGAIIIEGMPDVPPLPYHTDTRYKITFDNACRLPECREREDFHLYYDYLVVDAGARYQLVRVVDESQQEQDENSDLEMTNDDAACNPVTGGGGAR